MHGPVAGNYDHLYRPAESKPAATRRHDLDRYLHLRQLQRLHEHGGRDPYRLHHHHTVPPHRLFQGGRLRPSILPGNDSEENQTPVGGGDVI